MIFGLILASSSMERLQTNDFRNYYPPKFAEEIGVYSAEKTSELGVDVTVSATAVKLKPTK